MDVKAPQDGAGREDQRHVIGEMCPLTLAVSLCNL